MKILITFLIPLFLVFCCFGQTKEDLAIKIKTFQNAKRYSVNYDKFKDKTTVSFGSFSIYPTKESKTLGIIYLSCVFAFSGAELKESPENVSLWFSTSSRSWQFIKDNDLIFLIDGARLAFTNGYHDGKVSASRYSSGVQESVAHVIKLDDFKKIAGGKSVEFQLGSFAGALTDEHRQMLKDISSLAEFKPKSEKSITKEN